MIIAVLLSVSLVFASFDKNSFKPRTLTSWEYSIHGSALFPKSVHDDAFDIALTPMSTQVEYTGISRSLCREKLEFIKKLSRSVLHDENVSKMYEREIQVRENGFKFWIAVQKNVFPHLGEELERGAEFKIYYRFAGVAKKRAPVYLLEEFDSPRVRN